MKETSYPAKRNRRSERGSVLMVATMVIIVMLILAIPFLFKLSAGYRSTERGAKALSALNLAEAGVDKVMWWLDPFTYPSGSDLEAIQWSVVGANEVGVIPNMKTSDSQVMGNVQVVLTPPVGVAPDPQIRTLDSTGLVPFIAGNTVDRTVRVTLQRDYKSIFDVGFFVDQYFYIRNGFFLDAYDSRNGNYGASLSGGGTNSLLTDVYFGSNSYISDSNPNNPGDATWVIDQGGGSNDVYGTVMAGGSAAAAHTEDPSNPAPDPAVLDDVINVPNDGIFKGDEDRIVMKQQYDLPAVDVFNLPPKEMLGSLPNVGEWFEGYSSTDPSTAAYYVNRYNRAPTASEVVNSYEKGTFSGSGTLTPADNGIYTSFMIGGYASAGTLNISGGDVVIYVTSYGDASQAGNFYMGTNSSINIAEGSTLTLILGNASFTAEQGYNINAHGAPPTPADCVILGTNQFNYPDNTNMNKIKKAPDADAARVPGLMYFEHAQSEGNIYAALYAPKAHMADLQGQNHMNFFGSAIVKSMDFKVQVNFHYDKALADLKIINGGFAYWRIINWTEVVGQ
jgi:hypothetical protein